MRHIKIREIISSEQIETQDELVKRLNEYDLNVTQATVSRDIKELQLIKVPHHQVSMYIACLMIENTIH